MNDEVNTSCYITPSEGSEGAEKCESAVALETFAENKFPMIQVGVYRLQNLVEQMQTNLTTSFTVARLIDLYTCILTMDNKAVHRPILYLLHSSF